MIKSENDFKENKLNSVETHSKFKESKVKNKNYEVFYKNNVWNKTDNASCMHIKAFDQSNKLIGQINNPACNNFELTEHRIEQRQKQISMGKNTLAYSRYSSLVPRDKRKHSDPVTPNKYQYCSSRSWQEQIRRWRRRLHQYDPPLTNSTNPEDLFDE